MLHRKRTKEPPAPSTTPFNTTVSRKPLPTRSNAGNKQKLTNAISALSKPVVSRPSALPRSTSSTSGSRLDSLTILRKPLVPSKSTPATAQHSRSTSEDVPLIMDSSAYSLPGDGNQLPYNFPPPPQDTATTRSSLDTHLDTVLGIALPEKELPPRPSGLPHHLIPELRALASQPPKTSNPAVPSFSAASSPSTRFTESPAPWTASTASTTPVSWPSTSPGIVQRTTIKSGEKRSNTVPQPRIGRSRLPKLPILPEPVPVSIAPPSKSAGNITGTPNSKIKRKPVNETPAPTPPPRTSSAKRGGSRSAEKSGSSSIDETLSKAAVSSTAPSSNDPDFSPLAGRTRNKVELIGQAVLQTSLGNVHDNLQQSISAVPSRPSRDGTSSLGESRPTVLNHKAAFSSRQRQLLASAFEDGNETNGSQKDVENIGLERPRILFPSQPPPSPSRLGKLSRLAIFGRHTKSPSADLEKSPGRSTRKGPVAGTGHEGYGKYGKRGRKQSSETETRSEGERSQSSVSRVPFTTSSRKTSTSSTRQRRTSQSDLDEFAAPRLKPVVMRGGSQASTDREPDESSQALSPDNLHGRFITSSPVASRPATRERSPARSPVQEQNIVPKITPAHQPGVPPLALRRSQRFGPGTDGFRIPTPIRTDDLSAAQYITSHDTSQYSAIPTLTASSDSTRDALRGDASLLDQPDKKLRRPWWNPFRRRREPIQPFQDAQSLSPPQPGMAVSITAGPAPRSVPYYVVMESESENNAHLSGDYPAEAVDSPTTSPRLEPQDVEVLKKSERTSILLPAAPLRPKPNMSPEPHLHTSVEVDSPPVRQPRLAQVGRIPKVVLRSERQHVPSRRSFSQPFPRRATHDLHLPDKWGVLEPETERPVLEIHTDMLPSRPFVDLGDFHEMPASAPALTNLEHSAAADTLSNTLLRLPSKQGSDVSVSSSSEGMISILGPPLVPTTEIRTPWKHPQHGVVLNTHGDDEIWNEYDDFIDHVMSPSKSQKGKNPLPVLHQAKVEASTSSTPGMPNLPSLPALSIPLSAPRRPVQELSVPTSLTPPVVFPSPSMMSERGVGEEIRLRRSRIVSALHSSIDPSSPFSMREFLNEYGERYRDSIGLPERLSSSTSAYTVGAMPTSSNHSQETFQAKAEPTHRENAVRLDVVERTKNPTAQSELHYASLEVSRWLSFGRVLFSPAHEEIHTLPERNVLVIDGLGNEDWSIYCAVTYESEKAVVYDLKEGPHSALQDTQHVPANHRRTQIASLADHFPFHSAFFSAIVLRFPPAMAEAKLQNIITECRRTLVPGGHLEVMLLDIDIVNMGVQTRRAVRELKMKMATTNRDVSLKPLIDNFQTMLGGRGFSSLNRCVVGVPVAGRPSDSMDSSSSRSSGGSAKPSKRGSAGSSHLRHLESRSAPAHGGPNFSLNDLVADHSENADAKIGRMVSRTARSWWQHCFEASVIPDGDLSRSIFADRKVLGECKSRASSFKLLIAYAQRPVFEARRRTMSEPAIAALATAGTLRGSKPLTTTQSQRPAS